MRTLDYLPPEKRRRIAQETRDLYAPLAHRFGMAKMRWELEDLAFKHLEPEEYKALAKQGRAEARRARRAHRADARSRSSARSTQGGHQERRGHGPAEAPLVDLQEDEAAREAVRGDLRPPRHPRARRLGARLLPRARRHPRRLDAGAGAHQGLHRAAEVERLPVAAHDGVRAGPAAVRDPDPHARRCTARRTSASRRTGGTRRTRRADELDRHLAWFRQVLELQMDAKTPDEFLEFLKLDLYQDEIFVFTPTGDVIQLPKGATPIDFAFAVHTEVGLALRGREGQRAHRAALAAAAQLGDGRDHHVADGASRRATGSRTCARVARATRSARGCEREAQTSAEKLGQEILEREVKRRRLAQAGRRRRSTRRRARSSLTDATHLLASIGQGDVNVAAGAQAPLSRRRREASRRSRASFERLVDRVRGTQGRAHPGRRRAHGALRAVLPAGARAIRSSAT